MATMKKFGKLAYDKAGLQELKLNMLIQLYNANAETPVKAFRDKETAVERVWAVGKATDAAPKGERKAKAKGEGGARGSKAFPDDAVIKLTTTENHKRPGSRAFDKFSELMKFHGKTVGEFRALEGKRESLDVEASWPLVELRYAVNNGYAEVKAPRN